LGFRLGNLTLSFAAAADYYGVAKIRIILAGGFALSRHSMRDAGLPGMAAMHFALTANCTELQGVAHLSPLSQVQSLILHSAFGLGEAIADVALRIRRTP